MFFSNICDLVGKGRVLPIDIQECEKRPNHERTRYRVGSSTSEEIVRQVGDLIEIVSIPFPVFSVSPMNFRRVHIDQSGSFPIGHEKGVAMNNSFYV